MAREKLKSFKDLAQLLPTVPTPAEGKPATKKKDQNVVTKLPKKKKKKRTEAKRGKPPKKVIGYLQDLENVNLADVYKRGQHKGNVKTSGRADLFLFKNELQKHGLELFGCDVRVIKSVVVELIGDGVYDTRTCELISQFQRQYDLNFRSNKS